MNEGRIFDEDETDFWQEVAEGRNALNKQEMNKTELTFENNVLLADAGRVQVAYFEDRGELRVLRKADKEVLRKEPMETFNLSEFINTVNKYKEICNHK